MPRMALYAVCVAYNKHMQEYLEYLISVHRPPQYSHHSQAELSPPSPPTTTFSGHYFLQTSHFSMFHTIFSCMFHSKTHNILGLNVSRETLSCVIYYNQKGMFHVKHSFTLKLYLVITTNTKRALLNHSLSQILPPEFYH